MLPQEIEALAKCLAPMVVEQLAAKLRLPPASSSSEAAPAIRQMLTVEQFAACIERSPEMVRRKIRGQVIPKKDVSGPPYFIHPRALTIFGVTPEIASARLEEWEQRQATPAQSPSSTPQLCQA